MNAKQLERASYMAAHAIFSANISAPQCATPGARRSHAIDTIADAIRNVFELHCSALDESADCWAPETPPLRTTAALNAQMEIPAIAKASNQKLQLVMQELHSAVK
ncbi:MAG: hypothetical protein ABI833_00165 [Acidobacteriota bacterium]